MTARRLGGKIALITGGGSGIGRATAHRFVDEGAAHLFIVDIREDSAAKVVAELEEKGAAATVIIADVSVTDDCQHAIDQVIGQAGRLDILVSNAAAWTDEPFLEMKEESWNRVIAVNLKGSFIMGQRAARAMAEGGGGVILFTASISSLGGCRNFSHYNASKAGIASLVQTMAVELAGHGIRVNCISPGPTDTPQSVAVAGEELMATFRKQFNWAPIKRLGKPEDMAAAFAFLASDDAAYITGHNLVIDGGLLADVYAVVET
jgi:3-oxoacyl-[acyl-carrier protein] reductase